ncbi:hypothetical protein L6303_04120 [archaeon]|nr:hypothetical protein [Nanoarchaeota archaeon]MBU4299637.1 hypothetical protein [Nanoarchaeota archaeon]MBU4452627.1 hypothetical protein [Nanoarchaeota archaeon]MCG2723906.1 hypothetical protein [archaeon]
MDENSDFLENSVRKYRYQTRDGELTIKLFFDGPAIYVISGCFKQTNASKTSEFRYLGAIPNVLHLGTPLNPFLFVCDLERLFEQDPSKYGSIGAKERTYLDEVLENGKMFNPDNRLFLECYNEVKPKEKKP